MPFAAALSTIPETSRAAEEVCAQIEAQGGSSPDLAVVFLTPHHVEAAEPLLATLHARLQPRCLLGCTGESVAGNDREIEQQPALSLWVGRWNESMQLDPFHLTLAETPDGYSLFGWPDALLAASAQATVLLLADPYTFPADGFLKQMNENHPGVQVFGGMASAVRAADQNRLLLGTEVHLQGAVGVLLQGNGRVRGIVSQGCRPIGEPMVITRAQRNIILELGGHTPLARLQELWPALPERDRQLVQQGLHIGRVINEYQDQFGRGDFLVRNVMGLDQDSGALAVTDHVRVGQTVQFQVRDAATASEDLHSLLQLERAAQPGPAQAALLFTCNGRGTHLFDAPHHDARAVRTELGPIPLAGFFAAGELGPVGGQNFIHGFTASVALFEEG